MSEPNPTTDTVTADPGSGGASFAGWSISSVFWPLVRLSFGTGANSYEVDDAANQRLPVKLAEVGSVTVPVSLASCPLPVGAATAARQPVPGTAGAASPDVITVQGVASMNALKVDGSAVTQPVSNAGTFAVQASQSGSWAIGTVTTITGVTPAFGATGASVPANAGYKGLLAKTAMPAAVADGQLVGAMADKFGRQIVRNAPRENLAVIAASTTGTSGTLLAAQGANVLADIARLLITNSSASDVSVTISDGTNSYPFGLKAGTTAGWAGPGDMAQPAAAANTAWTYTVSSGVSTIYFHGVAVLNK